jgi:hypothetical protein
MENQHRHITGYRDLTAGEVSGMNAVKAHAEYIGTLVDNLTRDTEMDQRWVAIARTHLQQGFMALTRAVAKPTTF